MELLDAGFRSGGTVAKMVSDRNGSWQREEFPVYAPYTLAAINRDSLSETALDRAFVIEMKRKKLWEKKRKYKRHKCEADCQSLRNTMYAWALRNATQVSQVYAGTELERELDRLHLNDRAADIWLPILATARVIGISKDSDEWSSLTSLAKEMGGDPEAAEEIRHKSVVKVLRSKAMGGKVAGMTTDIQSWLREGGVEINIIELNTLLKQWGFIQKSIRLPQGPRHGWQLDDTALEKLQQQLCGDSQAAGD
jgi:hypothetical protein